MRPLLETCGFFAIDGLQLEYQLFIPAQDRELTLVLLHEGLGCVAAWKEFPHQLAQVTGCRVLTYSRAGYGGSDPCPLPRPLTFMHDEGLLVLPKILELANSQKVVLIGHSDGASIALIYAGGVTDQRLKGLILMAPHLFVEELTLASIRETAAAYQTTDLRQRLARYHGDNVDCAFLGWSQVWLDEKFLDWNLEAYPPRITVPVLLIQGEDDNYGTILQLESLQKNLPNAPELSILADCGHSPFRDQPTATLKLLADFLQHQ